MKKTIQILAILLLFTQCAKEEVIKPKERIGVYGDGIGVTAPTIIKYPDFELHVEKFSDYFQKGYRSPYSDAFLSIYLKNRQEDYKFVLETIPNSTLNNDDFLKWQVEEISIDNIPFRITFETFNWNSKKSTDEVLVVDKGRFLVEKVE